MITFSRLEVSNFRGIETADVSFTTGLNILHGPNELGKSSLLTAIRAALFLPVTSSEANSYRTWGTKQPPTVTLSFVVNDIQYRVHKQFGTKTRSAAELHRMKGTERFIQAKPADIDKELRQLIAWGMPEPGRGAPRGLPQSYLATALLGQQDEVELVLQDGTSSDRSDSGTAALTKALGTIGKDPLVSNLLDTLDERTSEVFTPTGQIKRTADSPLALKTRDASRAQTKLTQLQHELQQSQEIETGIERLRHTALADDQSQTRAVALVNLAKQAVVAESTLNSETNKKAEIELAQKTFNQCNQESEKLQSEYLTAKKAADDAEEGLVNTDKKLVQLSQKLESIEQISASETDARRSSVKSEITNLENQVTALQSAAQLTKELATLTAQRESAQIDLNRRKEDLTLAESQKHLAELLQEKERCGRTIEGVQTARNSFRSAQKDFDNAESESRTLDDLTARVELLRKSRQRLDDGVNNESELNHAKSMRAEAQRKYDSLGQQLHINERDTREKQEKSQSNQRQLANIEGRKQTLADSASNVTESRQQLLQSNIAAAKQRLSLAESASNVQKDINEVKHNIADIEQDISISRRNLDHAATDRHRRSQNRQADGNVRRRRSASANKTTKLPIATLAVTLLSVIGCVGLWVADIFQQGALLAPLVAGIGGVAAYFGYKSKDRSNQSRYRDNPNSSDNYPDDRNRLGRSADALRHADDRLEYAENELRHLHNRYDDICKQLDADPKTVIEQEHARIDDTTAELDQLDIRHTENIDSLLDEIRIIENNNTELNTALNTLHDQHQQLYSEHQAAQRDLSTYDARIAELIKNNSGDTSELGVQFNTQAQEIQRLSPEKLDYSSVKTVQEFQDQLKQKTVSTKQRLNNQRNLLATAKAELHNKESIGAEQTLKELDLNISTYIKENINKELNQDLSFSQAEAELVEATSRLDTSKSSYHKISGQEEEKRKSLKNISTNFDIHDQSILGKLTSTLKEKKTELNALGTNDPQASEQLAADFEKTKQLSNEKKKEVDEKNEAITKLAVELKNKQDTTGQAKGRLTELQAKLSDKEIADAKARIEKSISESAGTLNRHTPLTDQLISLEKRLEDAKKRSTNSQKLLQQYRGKLDMIGGSALAKKVQRQTETVQRIQQDAAEYQKESEAEKYLQEVITKLDEQHTAHLGRVLAKPVSEKFNELTGNRYGEFSLDPTLTAKTISADGDSRDYQQLSIGTRQQLAVLVKLSLAAQLKSSVVLDDQLVQSDPARLSWFCETLRESVQKNDHQIIVITCRPDDYVAACHDSASNSFVDLSQNIKRQTTLTQVNA